MKLLRVKFYLTEPPAIMLSICNGDVLRTAENRPVLCIEEEQRVIQPQTSLEATIKNSSDENVFAGVLEGTDQEILILREGSFKVRDLRNLGLADFLKTTLE